MHWADINAALYKAGSSPSSIATQTGYAISRVSRIIRGIENNLTIASAISKATGLSLKTLFPDDRYVSARVGRRAASSTSKAA
jgi:lambda repressor-like predicted transcriptional regulator